jgi:hypothetical protein
MPQAPAFEALMRSATVARIIIRLKRRTLGNRPHQALEISWVDGLKED